MPTKQIKKPGKPKPKEPAKEAPPDHAKEGGALWFARALLPKGADPKGKDAGDLLAIGVRMSEADRRRLVQIVR